MLPVLLNPSPVVVDQVLLGAIKLMFLIAFGLYIAFAFIATRQIQLMRKTVVTSLSPFITLLGYAHLVLSILAFIFVLLSV
jgi:hypothetical protein